MMHLSTDPLSFWGARSRFYDRLYWARDGGYLASILRWADLQPDHLVLDVGTGTGTVARAIQDRVKHVLAVDMSGEMLKQGSWKGISVLQWDVSDALFRNQIFDRVLARMVLHHAIGHVDRILTHCYDTLKAGGKMVVAEAIPPSDAPEVVTWFEQMFSMKERRLIFTADRLATHMLQAGFQQVELHEHWIENFSIRNWLENSGLPAAQQAKIMQFHKEAPPAVKQAHKMRCTRGDCRLRSRNVIMVGVK